MRYVNIFIDSCAFDPKYYPENEAADKIFSLKEKEVFDVMIAHSVKKEIEHPNTPDWVKKEALKMVYTIKVDLTNEEKSKLERIKIILAGNGKIENIMQDAVHIFEANKNGNCFLSTDNRIIKKRKELEKILLPLKIFKPSEFLEIIKSELEK